MAHYTGKDLYIEFAGESFNTDYRSLSVDRQIDTVEVSAGADTDKSYLTTLRDATFSVTYVDENASGTVVNATLYEGAYGTLTWGPEGTASGKPKFSCAAWVTSVTAGLEYATEVTRDVSLQKDGDWIENYDLSGDTW